MAPSNHATSRSGPKAPQIYELLPGSNIHGCDINNNPPPMMDLDSSQVLRHRPAKAFEFGS